MSGNEEEKKWSNGEIERDRQVQKGIEGESEGKMERTRETLMVKRQRKNTYKESCILGRK